MKTSLQWLSDFLPAGGQSPLQARAAADALTSGGLPVESIESHGSDSVLDVEVTSNRGDCLSHVGVARELSALLGKEFRDVNIKAVESETAIADAVKVRIDAPELCPHYTARIIRGVKIGPSPAWMTQRLVAIGVRPINNVVDVTNYVLFEMGQPLHAFDFGKVSGGQVIVRNASRGEKLVTLDGKSRELATDMLVIADGQHPIALAGVMGGAETEVSAGSRDILLESARFDPLSVRRTARALAMKSDSSYRFERGIDPTLPERASCRAAQLIVETAGGQLLKGAAVAGNAGFVQKVISLRLKRMREILGVELPVDDIVAAFKRLGLSPVLESGQIKVTVPSHRLDIGQEIDLIEEAARVLGYDRIPTREEISIRVAPPNRDAKTIETICQILTASGFFEAITFSFVSDSLQSDFGKSSLRADASVRKADAALRPSLLPGLLESVRTNETNGTAGAKLFEVGSVFAAGPAGQPQERRTVGCVGGQDVRDIRGVVEAVLARLDSQRVVRVVPDSRPGFAAGAGGRVMWGEEAIGFLGQIDGGVARKLSLRNVPVAAELDLQPLLAGNRHVPQLRALATFPAVRRDLSLIVAQAVAFEKIESLVAKQNLPFLEATEFVTTYRGHPLAAGTKSVTLTLVFRSPTATLTSEQVESSVQKTVAAAKSELNATLRT